MKVDALTDELLDDMLALEGVRKSKRSPKILTGDYVKQLNHGISLRIQERQLCHAASAELAAKARFR